MARITAAFAAISFLALSLAPASSAGQAGALTFAGQCQFAGTSSFSSLVTPVPAPVRNDVTANGTCSGTLTDRRGRTSQLSNAAVAYRASELGAMESCAGDPDATGHGELLFGAGALRFSVVENRLSGQAVLSYDGRRGGSGAGVAYVNSPDPVGLAEQCATHGISSAPVAIVFRSTPSISG